MSRIPTRRPCLVLWMAAMLSATTAVWGGELLTPSQETEWKRLFAQYEEAMKVAEKKISVLPEPDPQSANPFLDRLDVVTEIERELLDMDKESRAKVMPLFIEAVQRQLGGEGALRDTGGTKADQPGFRPGFGDYDLEAPQENIDAIRRALESLVPNGTVEDHGSYIEVEHLRLIVFKKSPIDSLQDFEDKYAADLKRDANDKEVYLHLRLPDASRVDPQDRTHYENLVKALEIQGHIKKGIHGALCNPQELIDRPEELQTYAKSAMKSLIASGMWQELGSREDALPVESMLKGVGWPYGVMGFEFQLHAYKNWAYINPLLFQNRESIQNFQKLLRNVLDLADRHAQELAEDALARLDVLQKQRPNDPRLEPLIIAAKLYLEQREVNQAKLKWEGTPDSLDALLRHFNLSDDFEILEGSSGGMHLVPSIRGSGGNLGGGQGFVEATWRSGDSSDGRMRSWVQDEPSRNTTLRLVIVDLGSVQGAIDAYRGSFYEDILRQLIRDAQELAAHQLQQTVLDCAQKPPPETKEMMLDSEFAGSTTHAEMMGGPRRNEARIDLQTENALLVTDSWVDPVIDQVATLRVEERLTSAEEIQRQKKSLQNYQGSLPIPQTTNPQVDARFRVTWDRSRILLDPGRPVRVIRRGLCRFGKCLVFVEEVSTFEHVQVSEGAGNYRIKSPPDELGEWAKLESPFLQLVNRRQPWRVSVELRTDGLDSRYRGVASDGSSRLAIAADVTGDEKSLARIGSVVWEVGDVPAPCQKGTIENRKKEGGPEKGEARKTKEEKTEEADRARIAGRTRRSYLRDFVPPETTPREHTQQIRLVVTSLDGDRVVSEPLSITVIPPPIVMVHGIWSDYRSMAPLRDYLVRQKATTSARCRMMQYEGTTEKSLLTNARLLRQEIGDPTSATVDGVLRMCRQSERIKVSRVNLVAHSLGGLLSRLVIQGRPGDASLPGDADKVLKLITIATPHQGSAMADWYAEWNPASFTDETDPSLQDFNDLRIHIRTLADAVSSGSSPKIRESAFEFGPAVMAMKTTPNRFLDALNEVMRDPPDQQRHLRYYLVAGTEPFCSREMANIAAVFFYYGTRVFDVVAIRNWSAFADAAALDWVERVNVIRASPIAPSEILAPAKLVAGAATSQRFQQMVVGVCDLMSVPDTDGVVVVNSANPTRLFGQQVGGSLEVAANHFAVVTNRRTMEAVYRWLTGVNPAPEGTQ